MRTKTLVKNCIVQIDSTPFAQWYLNHYSVNLNKKKDIKAAEPKTERSKKIIEGRKAARVIDSKVADQFSQQRLLACISSRPGQSGRADGYLLEGKELEFYVKKIEARKK